MTRTKPTLLALVLSLIPLGPLGIARAQEKSIHPEIAAQQKRGQIQKLLDDILIDTNDLQKEMPVAKLLVALEAKLPEGKKLSVRIDEAAFGKRLSQVTAAQVRLPFMKKVRLATVLRRVLAEVTKVEQVDYGIRPTGIVITRPQLTAHSMVYDVRDIVEQMPLLLPDLKRQPAAVYQGLKSNQGAALLVRLVINEVSLQPWENIQVLNEDRLVVLASPTRHGEVVDLLAALRRLSDVAVVMNARLYEVDRSFFTEHVAPLFAGDKDSAERPLVLPIEGPLFKTISQQKFLLASEDIKIKPNQVTPFLSRHSVFRFATGSRKDQEERVQLNSEDRMVTGTGLAGVSFDVRPLVSPDRRYLRLQISQKVSQLVGIKKTKTLDVSSGKELEVESPNLIVTSLTGTVKFLVGISKLMTSSDLQSDYDTQ